MTIEYRLWPLMAVRSEDPVPYRTWVCRGNVIYVQNWRLAPALEAALSTYNPPPTYLTTGEGDSSSPVPEGDSPEGE